MAYEWSNLEGRPPGRMSAAWFDDCNAVVDACEGPLLRYASRLLANRVMAEDTVEMVFIDYFRKCTEQVAPSDHAMSNLYESVCRHAARPMAKLDYGSSEGAAVAKAFGALGRQEQCVIMLRVFEGKSWEDVAAITGVETSGVATLLSHAMVSLAAQLRKAANEAC